MKTSVIVCTHNRGESLRETLESLASQDFPGTSYEIIVVDNCSLDRTKEIVHHYINQYGKGEKQPRGVVRYAFEERPGLSHARNKGIDESQGEIIVFIDDDAKADPSWLRQLVQVYEEADDAGCVGGRVILDWRVEKPAWWHPDLDEVFNGIHFSESLMPTSYPRYPYGTNISFKKDVLKKAGFFDPRLGRVGKKLMAGEETELCLRIERSGFKIYYEPKAVVYHRVEPEKLTKFYIRKRAFWHGRSHALIEMDNMEKGYVKRKSRYYMREILNWLKRMQYPIIEQKKYLELLGYVFEGIRNRVRREV